MLRIAKTTALVFLALVARSIGGPAVRAAATVGGDLFAPSPYGDFSVALLALGAIVSKEDPEGAVEVDLEGFCKSRDQKATGGYNVVGAVSSERKPPPRSTPVLSASAYRADIEVRRSLRAIVRSLCR
jgi:CO/xanthine dehydrogenase FAD-binding subunit